MKYRILKPNEIVRRGDEFNGNRTRPNWRKVEGSIGDFTKQWTLEFRRPIKKAKKP